MGEAVVTWRRFFLVQLPLAIVVIGLLCEAAALAFQYVVPNRHHVDELASEVVTDRTNYPVVLIGDSVTSRVSAIYRIGGPGEVGDIATNGDAGTLSELMLLRRYLQAGHRPRYLVVATSPDFLLYPAPDANFEYWIYSTFSRPDEHALLQRMYPNLIPPWRPAAIRLTSAVFEPLVGMISRSPQNLVVPRLVPSAAPQLETDLTRAGTVANWSSRATVPLHVHPTQRRVLAEMCVLARQYDFSISLVWAPTQPDLYKVWRDNGYWRRANALVAQAFAGCRTEPIVDPNQATHFLFFDKASFHLQGAGWQQLYANLLTKQVATLLAKPRAPR